MVFEAITELIADRNDCDPSEIKMETTFQELDIKVETVGDLVKFVEEKCGE